MTLTTACTGLLARLRELGWVVLWDYSAHSVSYWLFTFHVFNSKEWEFDAKDTKERASLLGYNFAIR